MYSSTYIAVAHAGPTAKAIPMTALRLLPGLIVFGFCCCCCGCGSDPARF